LHLNIMARLILLFLSVLLLLPLASTAADTIEITCEAGLDNYYKDGFFTGAVVELKNSGDEVDGEIVITGGSTGKEQIRRPVILPRGGWKRIELSLLDYNNIQSISYQVENKVLATITPPEKYVAERSSLVFGNIGTANTGLRVIAGVTTPKIYELGFNPGQVPAHWQNLEMFNAIVMAQPFSSELRMGQQEALVDWVHHGGHLVVFVGGEYQRMKTGMWRRLFPAPWQGTRSVNSLTPLAAYCGSTSVVEGRTMVSVPGPAPGETIVSSDTGLPLVQRVQAGRGSVTLLMFDSKSRAWNSWKDKYFFIGKCLGLEYFPVNSYPGYQSLEDSVRRWMGQAVTRKGGGLAGFFLFCVLYILCIGPADYLFIKRIRRPLLTWLTFPLFIVLFSGFVYLFIYRMEAGKMDIQECRIINLASGSDQVWGTSYAGITSLSNSSYNLPLEQKDFAVNVQGDVSLMTTQQPLTMTIGAEKAECSAYMPVGTMLFFRTEWSEPLPGVFEAELNMAGRNSSLVIKNTLPDNLSNCLLFYKNNVYKIGQIKRGADNIRLGQPYKSFVDWFNETGEHNPLYRLRESVRMASDDFSRIYFRLCWYERWARETLKTEKEIVQALNYNDTQTDMTRYWKEGQAVLLGETDYAPARFGTGGLLPKYEGFSVFKVSIPVTGGESL
jgi:hypothetical protein